MKRPSFILVVGIALTVLCCVLYLGDIKVIQPFSAYVYDWFLTLTKEPPKSGKVVLVDIDEKSLRVEGQWPWSRFILANLMKRIFEAGASVVALDIVFPEKDRTSPTEWSAMLNKRLSVNHAIDDIDEKYRDFDEMLATVLREGKVVLGCFLQPSDEILVDDEFVKKQDPHYRDVISFRRDRSTPEGATFRGRLWQARNLAVSLPVLNKVSATGFFNARPDPDNVIRSCPMIWGFGKERVYPALGLEALRLHLGRAQCFVDWDERGVQQVCIGKYKVPVDQSGRVVLNYRDLNQNEQKGFLSSFPSFSATDVLHGRTRKNALKDKIVFIGTSAAGLKDIRATPVCPEFAGVEIHATMVDNILASDVLQTPLWLKTAHGLVIILAGVFLTVLIDKGKSWLSFLVAIFLLLAAIQLSYLILRRYHVAFLPSSIALTIFVNYPVLTMMKFWQEERQKRRVRSMFGTMVSEDVLHYMERNPGSFALSGHNTQASVFFSDVRGFSTISEALKPEQVSTLLNHYLTPMTEIIMARGGYVDKYEGDLIMAEWGVPFETEDHAEQACLAALEQQKTLKEIRPKLHAEFGHEIHVRMGINSGHVIAGNMGSDRRFQYTVMGDVVNQAARFEPANKDYQTEIIVGPTTYEAAKNVVAGRLLDKIVVKGISRPISIYEILCTSEELVPARKQVVDFYEQALRLHWERKWDQALELLEQGLVIDASDGPSLNLQRRLELYKIEPPEDNWQGEYVRATKD